MSQIVQHMTIEDFWTLVDSNFEAGRELLDPIQLRNYRIAVDFHNLMYVCRAVVRRNLLYSRNVVVQPLTEQEIDGPWLQELLRRVLSIMEMGTTPLLVFDGPPPEEKKETRQSRIEKKLKVQTKLDALASQNMLGDGYKILEETRKLMMQMNSIPSASIEQARNLFQSLGIPVLDSNTDGERLCASLCIRGLAAAVYTSDGDAVAHGAPMVLRGWGPGVEGSELQGGQRCYYRLMRLHQLLPQMGLDTPSFQDFCILLGCDYNKRVRGIGPKRALELLRKHHNLEAVVKALEPRDTSELNFVRCRQLFEFVEPQSLLAEGATLQLEVKMPEPEILFQILSSYQMVHYQARIEYVVSKLPIPRNFKHFRREYIDVGGTRMEVVSGSYDKVEVEVADP